MSSRLLQDLLVLALRGFQVLPQIMSCGQVEQDHVVSVELSLQLVA